MTTMANAQVKRLRNPYREIFYNNHKKNSQHKGRKLSTFIVRVNKKTRYGARRRSVSLQQRRVNVLRTIPTERARARVP